MPQQLVVRLDGRRYLGLHGRKIVELVDHRDIQLRGQCTYCGHCKPCAAELDIAMINKFYDLATMQPEVPATIQSHYELLGHTASECIGCHACEARCPFGVPIARRMEQAAALFGR